MEYKIKEELDLLEIIIYEWSKESVKNIGELKGKYKQFEGQVDYGKIYRCIVDYRIDKYGTSSIVQWTGYAKDESKKLAQSMRNKKYKKIGAKYRQWKEQ